LAFDVEDINPTLEVQFTEKKIVSEWNTSFVGMRKKSRIIYQAI